MKNKDYLSEVLYTHNEIINKIKEISEQINEYYKEKENVLVVPIMDGSLIFSAELIKRLNFQLNVRSTKITSYYNNTKTNNNPKLLIHIPMDLVKDKNILIIDDLIDSGETLSMFIDYLNNMGAKEVKTCVLFNKLIKNRTKQVNIDFVGFNIPNEWVAGFGIDSQGYFRNLEDFGIVNKKYIK